MLRNKQKSTIVIKPCKSCERNTEHNYLMAGSEVVIWVCSKCGTQQQAGGE